MGRFARPLFVVGAAASVVLAPAVAFAAPVTGAPHVLAAGGCSSDAYSTITPSAQLEVSTQTPYVGERIEVTGSGYCPDETVSITLRGNTIATVTTDSSGAFDTTIRVTGATGSVRVCGAGATGLSADQSCATLTVSANGIDNQSDDNTDTNGSDGTAFTGVEIAGLVALALALLAGGAALTTAGRKRKTPVA